MSGPDANLAIISFEAQAIREHFEDAPDEDMIKDFSDDDLNAIGREACGWFEAHDHIWEVWQECVNDVLHEEILRRRERNLREFVEHVEADERQRSEPG